MEPFLEVDSQGRTIFSPWCDAGAGYVLLDKQKHQTVLRFLRQNFSVYLLFFLVGGLANRSVIPSISFFALVPLFILWYAAASRSLVRGLEVARERLPFHEYLARRADTTSLPMIVFSFVFCLLVAWGGVWILSRGHLPAGVLSTLVFGIGACCSAYLLRVKWERTRETKHAAKLREKSR
jgi:hypothetical protein